MIEIKLETIKGWVKEILDELDDNEIKEDYQIEIIAKGVYSHLPQDLIDRVRAEAYTLKRIMGRSGKGKGRG